MCSSTIAVSPSFLHSKQPSVYRPCLRTFNFSLSPRPIHQDVNPPPTPVGPSQSQNAPKTERQYLHDRRPESIPDLLDSYSIARILETSLVRTTHVIALEFSATLPIFPGSSPAVVIRYLDLLFSCVDVDSSGRATVLSGSEDLANAAVIVSMHILVKLPRIDPGLLEDLYRRYRSRLSKDATFNQQPASIITVLDFCRHDMSHRGISPSREQYKLSPVAHEVASKALTDHSRQQCQVRGKLPRWILRFVLHFVSQDALPPV